MFVSDWMTKKVYTVSPDDYLSDVITLMREKKIKHVPVVKDTKLKGILSDQEIKDYSPSKTTTLDLYEQHYVLATTKVRKIMRSKVVTTTPDTAIEEAAMRMLDNNIGCLPVLERGRLVGIISDKDIYRVLVDITGVRHGGNRICITIEDRPGSIREVADIIRKHDFHLQGLLTSYEAVRDGCRRVVLRTTGKGNFKGLKAELESHYKFAQIQKG